MKCVNASTTQRKRCNSNARKPKPPKINSCVLLTLKILTVFYVKQHRKKHIKA